MQGEAGAQGPDGERGPAGKDVRNLLVLKLYFNHHNSIDQGLWYKTLQHSLLQ